MTFLGLAAWVLVGFGVAATIWGITHRRRRRDVASALAVVGISVVGLVIIAFAGMGAFCVPPPGAACM